MSSKYGWGKQGHACCEIRSCASTMSWRLYECHKGEVNLATVISWHVTGFKIVVSACL